jgi:hypothetical protein
MIATLSGVPFSDSWHHNSVSRAFPSLTVGTMNSVSRAFPSLTVGTVLSGHKNINAEGTAKQNSLDTMGSARRRARCAFSDRNSHSRMSLDPTHVRLKRFHACDQWHSSRKFTPLTGLHCKLRPNTEGRDMAHTQMGMAAMINGAETVWCAFSPRILPC